MEPPRFAHLPHVAGFPSSWGVWGTSGHDRFGCLNRLSAVGVVEAARLVRKGAVFALNWSMGLPDPPLFSRARFQHEVTGDALSTGHDDVLDRWNTQSSSQWDGFRHIRNPVVADATGTTGHYDGVPDEQHGIDHWARRGIAGRAVVCDIGRFREESGRPLRHDAPDVIDPSELLACLEARGTQLRPGDVLLMRTGWIEWYEQQDREVRERIAQPGALATPGLDPGERTAEMLWDHGVAALGTDTPAVEVWPPGDVFAHTLLLPMLGLPLGELWDLEALAADCAADGVDECLFTSAPLNLPSGVASPPNALALK